MMQRGRRGGGLVALLVLAAALALAACGGGGSGGGGGEAELTGSGYPGIDVVNSREVKGSSIDRKTAPSLEVAWTLPLTAESTFGAYAGSPVIANGVIYSQDLESNVQAIDLESGEVLWTKKYEEIDQGPNGVVVQEGKVFGATNSAVFALDQKTGKQLWKTEILTKPTEGVDMAPGYHEGLVYGSTVPTNPNAEYPAGGVGTVWALNAKTGKKVWHFDTVPKGLWGKPKVNGGGGLWYPPSFDEEGFMYIGTGNPSPFPGVQGEPYGQSRPGANLYSDSLVKLDAKTGKLQWAYQATPHDLYDWDFQNPPILTKAKGREVAIGSGKSGLVVAVDAKTGKPVWKTAVGEHNGHDEDGLLAMRGETSKIKGGRVAPGTLGGVIAPLAADSTTVFVPVVNHPIEVTGGTEISENSPLSGEFVALDVNTGKELWSQEFEGAAFGAPVVANDMVFFATFDGTVHGLDAKTGGEVWQASLPAASNTGVTISGDTLIVPAGLPTQEGQKAEIVAYRVGG